MEFQKSQESNYRVEVSGWDARENFFVEKTMLDWIVAEKKEISLRVSLRQGCVVFVRLLQPLANVNNFPVAYQVVEITSQDPSGNTRVRLAQLRPRASFRETVRLLDEAAVRVA